MKKESRGSALVITLGLLAVLALLVFAFAFAARTERLAARNDRDRVVAQQYLDVALAAAMNTLTNYMILSSDTQGNLVHGSPVVFDFWGRSDPGDWTIRSPNVFVSFSDDGEIDEQLLSGPVTNLLPAVLWDEVRSLEPHWMPIEGVDERSNKITGTNGFIAYAVINCSGLLDAHCISSNQAAWLDLQGTDIDDADRFLRDRARDSADGLPLTNYLSLADLTLRNRGVLAPVSNLFTISYDPGPDVTVTNGAAFSNRDVALLPKWNVNAWTNGFQGDLSDRSDLSDLSDDLSEHYKGSEFRDWFAEVSNRFATIGFAAPEALAWNLVNFMDPDRVPQSDHPRPWQQPWPVEDVPLINEIAVAQVPLNMSSNRPNHYAPAVELWYPFVTNVISEADEAQLVVAVYTNWQPEVFAADTDWTNNVIAPDDRYGFVFTNKIERMEQGTDTEFVTATLPPPYLSFPVTVTRAGTVPVEDDQQYTPQYGDDPSRLVPHDDAGSSGNGQPIFYLSQTNLFLPLGISSYYTYVQEAEDETEVWIRKRIWATNTVHLLARVRLGANWVDEAAGYEPEDNGQPARTNLLVFTEPCGYEVDDPRRNGHREDWRRYLPADRGQHAWDEQGAERPLCSLDGATNLICNPWHQPYGQGLPLVHFNGPMRRAGEIGYLQQPESYPDAYDRSWTITNLWQSICLAARETLATNNAGYYFSAGSVLEFFTAHATNAPVRGLVNFSTTHTNVVGALMADLRTGWGANSAPLSRDGIDWMTRIFFSAQEALYGYESVPIGVGDMCYGIGQTGEFLTPPDEHLLQPAVAGLHWEGSLGSDTKEDLLRDLAERISFRQHIFMIVMAARTATPSERITADQRAVAVVIRDAYSGRWKLHSWERLTR